MTLYVNHTDRVIYVCEAANLAANVFRLEIVTGARFSGPHPNRALGAEVCVANAAGIEVMAPIDGAETLFAHALRDRLDSKGAGVFAVVFGVPDLAATRKRLAAQGHVPVELPLFSGDEPWAPEIASMAGALVDEVLGVRFIIGRIDYAPGVLAADADGKVTRNRDHLDHMAWVSTTENFLPTFERLSRLGGRRLDGPYPIPRFGIQIGICWETGLEVVAPLPPEKGAADVVLDRQGEGIYAVLLGVKAMAPALERAKAAGYAPGGLIEGGSDPTVPWHGKYLRFSEALIGQVINTDLMVCEVDYAPGIFVTEGPE